MSKRKIRVYSEIGSLNTVLLHRPGEEIENLTPNLLKPLLFDDIPYLKVARQEHDNFAKVLKDNGTEVLYLENLTAQAIKEDSVKNKFLDEIIVESGLSDDNIKKELRNFLLSFPVDDMIDKIISGVRKKELGINEQYDDYPLLMYPMPNLYFTRDPFSCIGSGISINSMRTQTRKRETIFAKYIFDYHHDFINSQVKRWYDRNDYYCIEGGDQLVLSKDVLAIGYSARTDFEAILKLAKNIFQSEESFKIVLAFEIPKARTCMHLDTVFTMVDFDKFTVHKGIEESLKVTSITYDYKNKHLVLIEEVDMLEKVLSKYLKIDVTLIRCGGGDKVVGGREQWNDGSNTLAVSPGKVITYERNYITNEILYKNNIKVFPIPSGELSRGRGGPRCMSMPLSRE